MTSKLPRERRINLGMSFQELLTATVRLRFNRQSAPNPDVFRAHMREAYRLAAQEAIGNGYSPELVQVAGFAVMAFLDETVATSQNTAFSNWWISPLAKELFPDARPDSFFRNVDDLLAANDMLEIADAIEVCYLCLLLGYRGVLASDGSEELADYLDKIGAKMLHIRGVQESLAPDWCVPPEQIEPLPADGMRRFGTAAVAISAIVCAAAFAFSKFSLLAGIREIHSLVR